MKGNGKIKMLVEVRVKHFLELRAADIDVPAGGSRFKEYTILLAKFNIFLRVLFF